MYLVIFNGPPKSGKDTLAKIVNRSLSSNGFRSSLYKFAEPLKDAVSTFFNLTVQEYVLYFENPEEKDKKQERFFGFTPREVLISFSEDWAKSLFGKGVFGKLAADSLESKGLFKNKDLILVTDCGFEEEVQGLIERGNIPASNVLVVKLQRKGTSFKNDSRSWLSDDFLESIGISKVKMLSNNGDPQEAALEVLKFISSSTRTRRNINFETTDDDDTHQKDLLTVSP